MTIRDRLSTILDAIGEEDLRAIVEEGLSAEKLKWAYCPDCHKKVQVDYPDLDKRGKLLALLTDQAKGKPAETKKITGTVTLKAVSEMSDQELAAIAEGSELPPAA